MIDNFQQYCLEFINSSPKCSLYKYICGEFCLKQYLTIPIARQHVKEIEK